VRAWVIGNHDVKQRVCCKMIDEMTMKYHEQGSGMNLSKMQFQTISMKLLWKRTVWKNKQNDLPEVEISSSGHVQKMDLSCWSCCDNFWNWYRNYCIECNQLPKSRSVH